MSGKKLIFLTAILLVLNSTFLASQNSVVLYNAFKPEINEVCILEPSYFEAEYFIKAKKARDKNSGFTSNASFEITYFNSIEAGPWPQEAIDAFEFSAQIWSNYISSNVPIRVVANWVALEGNVLGSAGPTLIVQINEGEANTWYPIALASAISGVDIVQQSQGSTNQVDYDIIVNINSSFPNWYFGTDANPPLGTIDLVTVMLHELGHGLGFTGTAQANNDNDTGSLGLGSPPRPIIYDRLVEDGFGESILSEGFGPSTELYNFLTGRRQGVFFGGDQAIFTNEGSLPQLFSPFEWQRGSSFSHLDQLIYTNTVNALMRPRIDNAFAIHDVGPIVCGIFADTGWPLAQSCVDYLASESIITLSSERIDFGITNAGNQITKSITVSNADSAVDQLVIRLELTDESEFFRVNGIKSAVLNPGESQEFSIIYQPIVSGQHNGTIELINNSNNRERVIIVDLFGESLSGNKNFELSQNYPNPFNASTSIEYAIVNNSQVRIDIFDIAGRYLQTLVNQEQTPGRFTTVLDADRLASGIYLYKIQVGRETEIKKMTLIK